MPLYEYECDACGRRFEQIQKFSDAPLETCAECGKGPVRRLLSSPAIQFKGAGWYVTDYAKSAAKKESGAAGGKSDTAAPAEGTPAAAPKADGPATSPSPKSDAAKA
jgi:putative FmdB family regulatory protein